MPDPGERPPLATAALSLVLVARNAVADLAAVVAAWVAVLEARNRPYEILLIDDGSTDDTAKLADALPRLRVLRHDTPRGFGAALRTGIAAAKHPLLATATCDRQYQPADLSKFLGEIDKVDLVVGSRLWMPVPWPLRWAGWLWRMLVRVIVGIPLERLPGWLGDRGQQKRWLARWLFGVRVFDVECAFRLYRREIFARIPLQSDGPFGLVEILAKANFVGCWMTQVEVAYQAPAGPPLPAPLDPRQTYLAECRRVFREPSFA
jgi:glycosyltransferase involved in cell wall biosynthesis